MLSLLLSRFSLRHARLAPGQTAVLVLILALGVGVFTSVRLANRAAVSSFSHFTDTLTGQSDWIIQAPAGRLPEAVLPELRAALGDLAVQIFPVVESTASEPPEEDDATTGDRFGRRTFTLLGVDLVAVANLAAQQAAAQPFFQNERGEGDFFALFVAEPQSWVSPSYAPTLPDFINLVINDRSVRLSVAGRIPQTPEGPPAPVGLMVMDLPQLQSLVGREGLLDRVEFVLEVGPRLEERRALVGQRLESLARSSDDAAVATASPAAPRWLLSTPGTRRETAETMTEAFRLNLTVLSLIALLVGLYLVFQALDGAVVRRRAEIAILRSLGVHARTIRRAWLAEAALLGIIGGALGLLLGWAGAQIAVRAVGQTVNALYYATSVQAANLAWPEALLSLAVGVVASVIAGWAPARAASETPPAQVLVRAAPGAIGGRWLRSWPLATGAILVGVGLVQLPPLDLGGGTRFPLAGHLAAFCGILGGGGLAALAIPALGRLFRPLAGRGATWQVALSHIARPTGRHRLSAAALVCAIGMAAGMAILVASFETSVRTWVQTALRADLYLSSSGAQSATSDNRLAPTTWRAIAAHPAVARATAFSAYPLQLEGKPTTLGGGDLADQAGRAGFMWVGAPPSSEALDPARNEGLALVSESFSERFRIQTGDTIALTTPAGNRPVRVAGIFADYGNERGTVLVDRVHTVRWFGDDHAASLALDLVPGALTETVRADLLATYPGLAIFSNSSLRAEILRIFRQTFSITYALQVIGLAVAVAGLALSLASVLLDRRDELTTLRALGFRHREIAFSTAVEGGVLALCATVVGLALSFALGWLLIHVINKQSFGWTLAFAVPVGQLAALAALVIGTGVL
ncbi:MAG: FtsX-like permease family protein, partial [Verrucomicrobia bacterium]